MSVTIKFVHAIPPRKGGMMPFRRGPCCVLAGCYETVGPPSREVYVREQVGQIQGWSYCEWDGATTPLSVKLYVKVEI